jgi:hypothetical protein
MLRRLSRQGLLLQHSAVKARQISWVVGSQHQGGTLAGGSISHAKQCVGNGALAGNTAG